jgi:uncharacterized membrane protein
MHSSLHIARLVGPVLSVIGLGMLISPDAYRAIAEQFLSHYFFAYISGVLAMVAGLAILNTHNIWTRDWRFAITMVGLILTCVGVFRVLAPAYVFYLGGALFAYPRFFPVCGTLFVAVGGFITFKGYVAYAPDPVEEVRS